MENQAQNQAQSQPQHNPNEVGFTEIIIPLGLSIFCGVGGFVWGLVRMAQGHKKPGWVAIGINAAIMMIGIIGLLGLTAVGVTAANEAMEGVEGAPSAKVADADKPTIEVTAEELFADYDKNEIKANAKYKGSNVKVTGTVSGIDADVMDDPVVKLSTGQMLQDVSLHDINADVAAELNKGDTISATCSEVSEIIGSPILRGCAVH